MARKIILSNNGMSGTSNAPTGYKYLGYDNETISEKNGATVSAIGGSSNNMRVYKAMLSQGGTNAPTSNVRINELGVTVTFQYVGVGGYFVIATGKFNPAPIFNIILPTNIGRWDHSIQDNDKTYLQIFDIDGIPVNGYLSNTPIEITIFV